MRIEILNTGSELLLGHTLNTHAAWFGQELFKLGLRIHRQVTVPDGEAIREAMMDSVERADVLIVTGGLGPTSDDLTREIAAEVMGLELMTDEAALRSLESFFEIRGRTMAPANLKQALIPVGTDVLPNPNGTAPGVYVPPRLNGRSRCALFLLPGPPRELYPMFHTEVVGRLRALSGMDEVKKVVELKFTGVGESDFHQRIDAELAAIRGLEYGYCAHIGEVDLRLIGDDDACMAGRQIALRAFPDDLINDCGDSLEATVVKQLTMSGKKIAVAESCTGGRIASRLTDVAGSSAVFEFGWVTYSNQAKIDLLGVDASVIEPHGAVSEEVVCAMAEAALRLGGADIAVAVSGIAGPGGGTEDKPVGTAWIALAAKPNALDESAHLQAVKVFHPRNREDFKLAVSQKALDLVRRFLISKQ